MRVVTREIMDRLPTPCLVIDLPAADRNIHRMTALLGAGPVRLRPHFKAHKCTQLLRRQVAAGGCTGVTCQTPAEALVLAKAGFDDILVASPTADSYAMADLADAAALARITVTVDCLAHIELLTEAAERGNVEFDVLVEIDVGLGRSGLPFGSADLIPLARAVEASPPLRLRGLQAYEGHIMFQPDRSLRETLVLQTELQIRHEIDRLAAAGLACPVVSGGGTGTADLVRASRVLTELQAGSYVLLDAAYAATDLQFEPALYCLATLISRRAPNAGALNAGLKQLAVDHGLPQPVTEGFRVLGLSDEHTRIALDPSSPCAVGDKLLLMPSHVDPTVNLHDALYVVDADRSVRRWLIDGRRVLPDL